MQWRGWSPKLRPSPCGIPWNVWSLLVNLYMEVCRALKNFRWRWGPSSLGWKAWLIHRKLTRPPRVLPAECDRSRSNGASVITEFRLKSLTPPKVIGTDTDRSATYDFLLEFHSNTMGPAYLVPIPRKTAISVENRKFFPPRVINAPLRGFAVELGNTWMASRN